MNFEHVLIPLINQEPLPHTRSFGKSPFPPAYGRSDFRFDKQFRLRRPMPGSIFALFCSPFLLDALKMIWKETQSAIVLLGYHTVRTFLPEYSIETNTYK